VPLAAGATIDDIGFGEDFELLAAVDDPRAGHSEPCFAVVGRVQAGDGVVTLRNREPYELRGWEHFI